MFEPSPASVESIVSRAGDYVRTLLSDAQALRGQQLRGGGPVAEFEQLLAERCGFPHCLATSNATTALLVAVLASDLQGNAIVADRSAWAGSLGALELGMEEVQVKASGDYFPRANFHSDSIAAVLASDEPGKRHDQRIVRSFCDQTGCLYIEDTDRIPGISVLEGEKSLADIQVLSFGPGKPMCLGEGGALLVRDSGVFERAMALSQHSERLVRAKVAPMPRPPFNARIHPLSALIGASLLRACEGRSVTDSFRDIVGDPADQ